MKKKLIIILSGFILITLFGIISCDLMNIGCGPFPDKYKVDSLDINFCKTEFLDSAQTVLSTTYLGDQPVSYYEFSIYIFPQTVTYFSAIPKVGFSGFMNNAYACSPRDPETDEKITDIEILCNEDFDLTHQAGSNLADLFNVFIFERDRGSNWEKYDLNEYLLTIPKVPFQIVLMLKSIPSQTAEYTFTVKYHQEGIDKDYFEWKSEPVVIQK